jgi:hypothetical protein
MEKGKLMGNISFVIEEQRLMDHAVAQGHQFWRIALSKLSKEKLKIICVRTKNTAVVIALEI